MYRGHAGNTLNGQSIDDAAVNANWILENPDKLPNIPWPVNCVSQNANVPVSANCFVPATASQHCAVPERRAASPMDQDLVTITFHDVPKSYRFRYESDFHNGKPAGQGRDDVDFGEIKIENAAGKVTLEIELVDKDYKLHVNKLYLRAKSRDWRSSNGRLMATLKQSQTLSLPPLGIIRMKEPNTSKSAATPMVCSPAISSPASSLGADKESKSNNAFVVLHCVVIDADRRKIGEAYSHAVVDFKSSIVLDHINPNYGSNKGDYELSLLGSGFTGKCQVRFHNNKNFDKYVKPHVVHKKVALVVKAPHFADNGSGTVLISVVNGTDKVSNEVKYLYIDPNKGKRKSPAIVGTDHSADGPTTSADADGVEDEDVIDGEESDAATCDDLLLSRVAHLVASGEIRADPTLCRVLAASRYAMLAVKDDHTPLAAALVGGKLAAARRLLEALPPDVRQAVMGRRWGDDGMAPLLLLARSQALPLPPDLVCAVAEATPQPLPTDSAGNSLLHLLIAGGREEDLRRLLALAQSKEGRWLHSLLDVRNNAGDSPLRMATARGRRQAAVALVDAGADKRSVDGVLSGRLQQYVV